MSQRFSYNAAKHLFSSFIKESRSAASSSMRGASAKSPSIAASMGPGVRLNSYSMGGAMRGEFASTFMRGAGGPTFASGFAFPQPSANSPPPTTGSVPQARSFATGAVEEVGDEDSANNGFHARLKTTSSSDEDDDETLRRKKRLKTRKKEGQTSPTSSYTPMTKLQRETKDSEELDRADPLEFKILAQDAFRHKPSEMIPIPHDVRQAMFKYSWDKILVDVRRTAFIGERGKVESYTAMVAVGNHKGLFGLGLADADTAQDAVARAHMDAYSNLNFIPLYRGHTIFHQIEHHFHRFKMLLMPRYEGWGVKASDLISELLGLIGIKNISVRLIGNAQSKFYVAACLKEALAKQSVPQDGIEGSGVYLREVLDSPAAKRRIEILSPTEHK